MSISPFATIEQAPADPILGLTEAFRADPDPRKVNLGVGVYQDEAGKVPTLDVVREAEERLLKNAGSRTYLPIDGAPAYNRLVQELLLGPGSRLLSEGRVVTIQAPGGTGALRVGADFLRRFFPGREIRISQPSWENHRAIFEAAGFTVNTYRYYDAESHGLDFEGMMNSLAAMPDGSIVVLHACCHNPSGVDLNADQWKVVVDLFRTRSRIAFLDFAYQGLGAGIDEDAYAIRAFAEAGIPCLISSSFSKSFSLYNERVGALSLQVGSAEEAQRVRSQLKRVIRTNYSNPPAHGAQVVALVLGDPDLRARWEQELAGMRSRIHSMRRLFVKTLREKGARQDFSFIERQQGMFSFSGLSLETVRRLRSEYSLYIVDSGRICVAAMNTNNMDYICSAIVSLL
ncbi:MAG TPA: amino acid aminotransferase [Armatimonadota bacterium]|nr:amino acid aminotransferase [Armatimonadota bacterium]